MTTEEETVSVAEASRTASLQMFLHLLRFLAEEMDTALEVAQYLPMSYQADALPLLDMRAALRDVTHRFLCQRDTDPAWKDFMDALYAVRERNERKLP